MALLGFKFFSEFVNKFSSLYSLGVIGCLLNVHFLPWRVWINFNQQPSVLDQSFRLLSHGRLQGDFVFAAACSGGVRWGWGSAWVGRRMPLESRQRGSSSIKRGALAQEWGPGKLRGFLSVSCTLTQSCSHCFGSCTGLIPLTLMLALQIFKELSLVSFGLGSQVTSSEGPFLTSCPEEAFSSQSLLIPHPSQFALLHLTLRISYLFLHLCVYV